MQRAHLALRRLQRTSAQHARTTAPQQGRLHAQHDCSMLRGCRESGSFFLSASSIWYITALITQTG
jgi:hypothetical protein